MKHKAVVFDMDGVIFDTERIIIGIWDELAREHGIRDIDTVCRESMGVSAVRTEEIFYEHYGPDFPYRKFQRESGKIFAERYSGGRLPVKTGVRELLDWLAKEHISIGLASSTRETYVRQELGDAGLLDCFEALICGDMVTRSKPAPDIYLLACRRLGVEPQEAVAIEDSYNGIRSAAAAGLTPVMVPDMAPETEEMRGLARCILPDLLTVRDWLAAGEP